MSKYPFIKNVMDKVDPGYPVVGSNWTTISDYVRTLPFGHYARKEHEQMVKHEYEGARKVEAKYYLPVSYMPITRIARFVGRLTVLLHVKPVKRIIINSTDVHRAAGAHYDRGEIHFPPSYNDNEVSVRILLHEFTHHVCRVEKYGYGHDERFCEMEELVFQAAMEILGS